MGIRRPLALRGETDEIAQARIRMRSFDVSGACLMSPSETDEQGDGERDTRSRDEGSAGVSAGGRRCKGVGQRVQLSVFARCLALLTDKDRTFAARMRPAPGLKDCQSAFDPSVGAKGRTTVSVASSPPVSLPAPFLRSTPSRFSAKVVTFAHVAIDCPASGRRIG